MNLTHIKQQIAYLERAVGDNPMVLLLIIAGVLAALIFGTMIVEAFMEKRKLRQKAAAFKRLQRHHQRNPNPKS